MGLAAETQNPTETTVAIEKMLSRLTNRRILYVVLLKHLEELLKVYVYSILLKNGAMYVPAGRAIHCGIWSPSAVRL